VKSRQRRVHDQTLAPLADEPPAVVAPREALVDPAQPPAAARVDEEPGDVVEEVVAGRAGDLPVGRQRFVEREDLLREHVDRPPIAGLAAGETLQVFEVARGIEQAVGVVDTHAPHEAVRDQLLQQGVDGVEDDGVFDTDAGKRVDVEEAPVVDLVGRGAP